MKFTVSSSAMRGAIAVANKAINSKSVLPILGNIKLDFTEHEDGTRMTITGSDSETVLSVVIPVSETADLHSICLPTRTCLDMLSQLPEQPVVFSIDRGSLEVTVDYLNGRFTFMAYAPDEYPIFKELDAEAVCTTLPETLLTGVCTRLYPFAGNDKLRPVMNGIYFDFRGSSLFTVASDGHKLLKKEYKELAHPTTGAFILPASVAAILKTCLKGGDISVAFDAQNIRFQGEAFTLTCRQIEGRYPNYNSVIPSNPPYCLTVGRKELIAAILRMLVMSSKASGIIRFMMQPMDDSLHVSAENIDFSTSATESVSATHTAVKKVEIGFNGEFLKLLLETATSDSIDLRFTDPATAALLYEHEDDTDYVMLLMPMMLNN